MRRSPGHRAPARCAGPQALPQRRRDQSRLAPSKGTKRQRPPSDQLHDQQLKRSLQLRRARPARPGAPGAAAPQSARADQAGRAGRPAAEGPQKHRPRRRVVAIRQSAGPSPPIKLSHLPSACLTAATTGGGDAHLRLPEAESTLDSPWATTCKAGKRLGDQACRGRRAAWREWRCWWWAGPLATSAMQPWLLEHWRRRPLPAQSHGRRCRSGDRANPAGPCAGVRYLDRGSESLVPACPAEDPAAGAGDPAGPPVGSLPRPERRQSLPGCSSASAQSTTAAMGNSLVLYGRRRDLALAPYPGPCSLADLLHETMDSQHGFS